MKEGQLNISDFAELPKGKARKGGTRVPKTLDAMIGNLVGTFSDPIIVFPGGWGDTLPGWIKEQIILERLIENMKENRGEQPTGTDAEATAYLYTASLTQPMDHDWTKIYLYLAGKTYARANQGKEVPEDIKVESLNDDQTRELNRLKEWLYRKRTAARLDKEKAERRRKQASGEGQNRGNAASIVSLLRYRD